MTDAERELLLLLAKVARINLDTPGSASREIRDLIMRVEARDGEEARPASTVGMGT